MIRADLDDSRFRLPHHPLPVEMQTIERTKTHHECRPDRLIQFERHLKWHPAPDQIETVDQRRVPA